MWLIFIHSSQDVLIEAIITKIEGTIRYFILVPYNAVWYFPEGTNLPLLGFWVFWKSMWKKAFTNLSQVQSYILFVFCFGRGLFCFCFYWALDNGLWSISASYAPLGRCPFWFSWGIFLSFCFCLESLLLLAVTSSGPLLNGSSLEDNFFSLGLSCFLTLRGHYLVLIWWKFSSSWKDFYCQLFLQDHYKPAPPWKKHFFFLGLEKETDGSSIPFFWEPPGALRFSSFGVFLLSPHTPRG